MSLYQKTGLQSCWVLKLLHRSHESNITWQNSAVLPPDLELFTKCISGFLIRGFCSHLIENEAVITPCKITLFKSNSWNEQQIRCGQKCRYFKDISAPICQDTVPKIAKKFQNNPRSARISIDSRSLIVRKMATNAHMADNTNAHAVINGVIELSDILKIAHQAHLAALFHLMR